MLPKHALLIDAGIPPRAHVMVNATHTHTGVAVANLLGVDEDDAYIKSVPLKIADAVELAVLRLPACTGRGSLALTRNASLSIDAGHMKDGTVRMNPGVNNPDLVEPTGTIDPELAMMFVEAEDGTPIAAVANFSLHYIGTNNGNALSADYFGHFDQTHATLSWVIPVFHFSGTLHPDRLTILTSADRRNGQRRGHQQAVKMANVLAGHFHH